VKALSWRNVSATGMPVNASRTAAWKGTFLYKKR
jgi:hypothetical protein